MVCDLCHQRAARIIQVGDWQVCQWCSSHHVLQHAIEVDARIEKLREAVAVTSSTHKKDVLKKKLAKADLQCAYDAYEDLSVAMKKLTSETAESDASLVLSVAAESALNNFTADQKEKTRRARCREL